MANKVKPLSPLKVKISYWEQSKIGVMIIVQFVLWVAMIIAGVQVLVYWVFIIISKGIFDSATIQYSIIVAVGAYFCLILDKNKIDEAMNIKRDLPYIDSKELINEGRKQNEKDNL